MYLFDKLSTFFIFTFQSDKKRFFFLLKLKLLMYINELFYNHVNFVYTTQLKLFLLSIKGPHQDMTLMSSAVVGPV